MTRLDFCLAHQAAARREAEVAHVPELAETARGAEEWWSRLAADAQQPPRRVS